MDNNINGQGYPQNYGSSQQQSYGGQQRSGMPPQKPENNLILAIFTTICCCLPIGIYAIIKASKVDGLYNTGQYQAAYFEASEAKKWSLIGIGVGAVINIIYMIFYGFAIIQNM